MTNKVEFNSAGTLTCTCGCESFYVERMCLTGKGRDKVVICCTSCYGAMKAYMDEVKE